VRRPVAPVVLHDRAQAAIDEILDCYEREAPHVRPGFIDALEAAVHAIGRAPSLASPRFAHQVDWPGLRSLPLKGFPHIVFFVEQPRQLAIIRVLHQSRELETLLEEGE
jgi:toxin ParE1/3/4